MTIAAVDTLFLIHDTLKSMNINPMPFVGRCKTGFAKYGHDRHLSKEYDAVQERIEEIQDGVNQCIFSKVRKEYNWRSRIVLFLLVLAYKISTKEKKLNNKKIKQNEEVK